jgi:O-acetylserine/cysteine efflux transporter
MNIYHTFLAILVAFLWGLNFVVAKILCAEIPVFFWLTLRYLMVAILLLSIYPKPPISIKSILMMSLVFGVLNSGLRFSGIYLGLDASLAVVVDKLSVPLSVLLSTLFLGEKIRWRTILGITISLFGILVLTKTPEVISNFLGFLLVALGALAWAIYNLQVKMAKARDSNALLAWVSLVASLMLGLMSAIFEQGQFRAISEASLTTHLALLYTGLGSILLGHCIWYYLLSRYSLSSVAPFSLLEPVFGIVSAVIILNEAPGPQMLIGSAIAIMGVAIIVIRRPQHARTR